MLTWEWGQLRRGAASRWSHYLPLPRSHATVSFVHQKTACSRWPPLRLNRRRPFVIWTSFLDHHSCCILSSAQWKGAPRRNVLLFLVPQRNILCRTVPPSLYNVPAFPTPDPFLPPVVAIATPGHMTCTLYRDGFLISSSTRLQWKGEGSIVNLKWFDKTSMIMFVVTELDSKIEITEMRMVRLMCGVSLGGRQSSRGQRRRPDVEAI